MLDLTKIPFIPSPNKSSRGGVKPTHLIIHAMNGTQLGTIAWFKNPKSQVSAHYLVSKKGEIVCMVPPGEKAWHVKNFNTLSIGVEFEDLDPKTRKTCVTDPNWWTEPQIEAGAELFATIMQKYNIPLDHVVGHNAEFLKKAPYFNNHTDPNRYWPTEKFKALIQGFLDDGNKPK
jgi:N-acetyl-anhydromuramyl-L-alanine amidase AmpD